MKIKLISDFDILDAIVIYNKAFNKKIDNIYSKDGIYGLYRGNNLIGIMQIDYINNKFSNIKEAIINNFCIKLEEQNKGYGKYFLENIIILLRQNNIERIMLTSNNERKKAIHLYESLGFKKNKTNIFIKGI